MNQSPPDLFPQRPVRSEFERAPSYRARRFTTILVVLLLIGGAAYHFWPAHSVISGEIPTIKADANTYKQKPEQPGGIDIPHQDVQVYEALDTKDDDKQQVEHLLPPPETPQSNTPPVPSNSVTSAVQSAPPLQTENLTPSKAMVSPEAPPSLEPLARPPVQTTVDSHPAAVTPPPAVASAPTPVIVPAVVKAVPTPAPVTTVTKAKTAPAATSTAKTGKANHAIQLASVQDEKSAHDMMQKLQSHYSSILGDTHLHLVKADLGSKGIFYRIRSQPLTEDQANKMCDGIKRMKAGCILVR